MDAATLTESYLIADSVSVNGEGYSLLNRATATIHAMSYILRMDRSL